MRLSDQLKAQLSAIVVRQLVNRLSKARSVSLKVFGVRKHTGLTHIPLIIAPVLFPFGHVVKPGAKLLSSNSLNDLFAAVTFNFD